MDPGLRLLASRWFFTSSLALSVAGTAALVYVLVAGVDMTTSNTLRFGVVILLSYMGTALSIEARKAIA